MFALEKCLNRGMGQVARGEDVRGHEPEHPSCLPTLGQVYFNKRAKAALEFCERMQRLHGASALRPSTTGASGECNDGNLASLDSLAAQVDGAWGNAFGAGRVAGTDLFDQSVGRKAILH